MSSKASSASEYDDHIGWARVDDVLSPARARSILAACEEMLHDLGTDLRVGDKPHGGTRRLTALIERVPEVLEVVARLEPTVRAVLDGPFTIGEATYRCPEPGFGQQKLHADAVPRLEPGPNLCATAIVPLTEFTDENGATRAAPGSHHRPDLQRKSGNLDSVDGEIRFAGPVGVGFVFSGHLLHSGMQNNSSAARPCLQFIFNVERP